MLRCAYFSEELEQWMTDGVHGDSARWPQCSVLSYSDSFLCDCLRQPACESVCVHVMLVGYCVAGVLVLLAFVLNFCLW